MGATCPNPIARLFEKILSTLLPRSFFIGPPTQMPHLPWNPTIMTPDDEHLRLLAIFHYVVGGLAGLFSFFPLLYGAMGLFILHAPEHPKQGEPPPHLLGWFFIGFGCFFFLLALAFAVCVALSGRFIRRRRHYWFSFVIACIECSVYSVWYRAGGLYRYRAFASLGEGVVQDRIGDALHLVGRLATGGGSFICTGYPGVQARSGQRVDRIPAPLGLADDWVDSWSKGTGADIRRAGRGVDEHVACGLARDLESLGRKTLSPSRGNGLCGGGRQPRFAGLFSTLSVAGAWSGILRARLYGSGFGRFGVCFHCHGLVAATAGALR